MATKATEQNSRLVKMMHRQTVETLVKKGGMKKAQAERLMRTNPDKGYCLAFNL